MKAAIESEIKESDKQNKMEKKNTHTQWLYRETDIDSNPKNGGNHSTEREKRNLVIVHEGESDSRTLTKKKKKTRDTERWLFDSFC